jgi:hypothetical protein
MDGDGAGGTAAVHHNAHSPEDVFRDFRARRVGIVKALTTGQLASRALSLPPLSAFVLDFCMLQLNIILIASGVMRRYGEVLPAVRPR